MSLCVIPKDAELRNDYTTKSELTVTDTKTQLILQANKIPAANTVKQRLRTFTSLADSTTPTKFCISDRTIVIFIPSFATVTVQIQVTIIFLI